MFKKIVKSALFLMSAHLLIAYPLNACSVTQCYNGDCLTIVVQYENDWAMSIHCDSDGAGWGGGGSGDWNGSIDGECGTIPCLF